MTEFEVIEAYRGYVESVLTFMTTFISITSAFLLVTYAASRSLTPLLARLTVTLYAVSSLYLIMGAQRMSAVILDIRGQMRGILNWHVSTYEPQWILVIFNWLLPIFMCALFIGSLWYFFSERNENDANT